MNEIKEIIDNKKYGWVFFIIFSFLLGSKIAGIIGSLGAGLIALYFYKIVINTQLSKKKKFAYSSLLIVGGLIITAILYITLIMAIEKLSGHEFVKEPEVAFIANNNDTSSLTINRNDVLNDLNSEYVVNEKYNFKVRIPTNWVLVNNENELFVQYTNPNNIADMTFYSEKFDSSFSLQEYAAGYINGSIEDGAIDLKVINKGLINNMQNAYYLEYEFSIVLPNLEKVRLKSLTIFKLYADTIYVGFASSDINIWDTYKEELLQSLDSFEPMQD